MANRLINQNSMLRQPRLTYLILFIIVIAAFILRVYHLGGHDSSFTADEITTITNSKQALLDIPKLESWTPLYAYLLGFEARVLGLGYSEFMVYFLSVIASTLAVVVVYSLGNQLFNQRVGLVCAFMLAFSVYNIYWARSARYYALMVLLSTLAFLFLYKALVTNQKKAWLLYALFRTLSLYNHLTAVWVFAGEGIFALSYTFFPAVKRMWERRSELRSWRNKKIWPRTRETFSQIASSRTLWFVISFGLIFLAYSPVLYLLIRDIFMGSSVLRISSTGGGQMAPRELRTGQLQSLLGGGWKGPFLIFDQLTGWILPLHVIFLVIFVVGVIFCGFKRRWTPLFFILTIILTPFVLSTVVKSYSLVQDGRYLISLLPLYYVMIAYGVDGLGQFFAGVFKSHNAIRKYAPMVVMVTFAVVIAGFNLTRIPLTFRNTGHNWRAVSAFLAQHAKPDELIVVHGISPNSQALQYYLPGYNVVQNDPSKSYDSLYQNEAGFWLVFEPGTSLYNGLRYWANNMGADSLAFASGWYPDIDQNSELAPAQNWDLNVVYASRNIDSAEALNLNETWVKEAEANNPGDLRKHLSLAEAYQRFDRCGQAINEYNLALKEGYVNDQLASYIHDARAECWIRFGRNDLAIKDWQQAISHADWSQEPTKKLGFYYFQTNRWDKAQALFQSAQQSNPDKSWPFVLLGDLDRWRGLPEQAIANYRLAIEREPGNGSAYQHLAEVYLKEGDPSRITSLYREAMQRNPWTGWPYFQLGQFLQYLGKVPEAVTEYQKASELQPELIPAISEFLKDARWDLSKNLSHIQVNSDQGELLWWVNNSWVKPYPSEPEVLVGDSTLMVDGRVRSNQILFHPFSNDQNTAITFQIQKNPFTQLKVGFGLPDEIAGRSNGVRYLVEVRKQGEEAYEPLLDTAVNKNIWEEKVISLLPYWGEDLDFRLTANAQGDNRFDWLQTSVELIPPVQPVWDLSANLSEVQFSPDDQRVKQRDNAFISPSGARLAGPSEQVVDGRYQPGQISLHPISSTEDSTLLIKLPNNPYSSLKTWFGLADEALPFSNGVDYTVSVSTDGGLTFVELVQTAVTSGGWHSEMVDLPTAQDLVLKLSSSARQDFAFDWLQLRLDLIP